MTKFARPLVFRRTSLVAVLLLGATGACASSAATATETETNGTPTVPIDLASYYNTPAICTDGVGPD